MRGGIFDEVGRLEQPPPVRDRRVCRTISGDQLTSGKDPGPGFPEDPRKKCFSVEQMILSGSSQEMEGCEGNKWSSAAAGPRRSLPATP
jgi:hypothetical protein